MKRVVGKDKLMVTVVVVDDMTVEVMTLEAREVEAMPLEARGVEVEAMIPEAMEAGEATEMTIDAMVKLLPSRRLIASRREMNVGQ
jgi:hypothetical protein